MNYLESICQISKQFVCFGLQGFEGDLHSRKVWEMITVLFESYSGEEMEPYESWLMN